MMTGNKLDARSRDRQEHVRCNDVARFVNRNLAIETAAINRVNRRHPAALVRLKGFTNTAGYLGRLVVCRIHDYNIFPSP